MKNERYDKIEFERFKAGRIANQYKIVIIFFLLLFIFAFLIPSFIEPFVSLDRDVSYQITVFVQIIIFLYNY